jgi:hypothetical protein
MNPEEFKLLIDRNNLSGCIEWPSYKNNFGYGYLKYNKKIYLAHRFSYMVYIDVIPDGLCVLHKCDNPSCINPSHLFLGTDADNVTDRENKNRGKKSSKRKFICKYGHKRSVFMIHCEECKRIRSHKDYMKRMYGIQK